MNQSELLEPGKSGIKSHARGSDAAIGRRLRDDGDHREGASGGDRVLRAFRSWTRSMFYCSGALVEASF